MVTDKIFFYILIIATIIQSCAPTRSGAYLNKDMGEGDINSPDNVFFIDTEMDDTIRISDELFIRISSPDEQPTLFDDQITGNTQVDLISYLVNDKGEINLPYINDIKIAGLTIPEASKVIADELSSYILLPTVFIKFVNFRITVLGEVSSPGVFLHNSKNINIFQALGNAGDISDFGNKKKVLVIRQVGNKVTKKYLDLTKDTIIHSDWYVLHSNDIIYVEPLARKSWGLETFPWNLITSVISTTILIMTFMVTLLR